MHLRAREKQPQDARPKTGHLDPPASADPSISNRNTCRVELTLTHSKQRIGAHSTRHQTRGAKALLERRLVAFLRTPVCAALAIVLGAVPALAGPRPSKALTVERIYGGPSLSGSSPRESSGVPTASASRISSARHRAEMWTMDAAKGDRKVLVKANVLE